MARMKQPGRVNLVSLAVVLLLGAAAYGAVKFGPVYWRRFKVKSVLSESINRYYRLARRNQADEVDALRAEIIGRIRKLGVEDAGLQVEFEKLADEVRATATYREVIRHPFVKRDTTLHLRPYYSIDTSYRF